MVNNYGLPDELYGKLEKIPDDASVVEVGTSSGPEKGTTGYFWDRIQDKRLRRLTSIDIESKEGWQEITSKSHDIQTFRVNILDPKNEESLISHIYRDEDFAIFGASDEFLRADKGLAEKLAKRVVELSTKAKVGAVIIYPQDLYEPK